MTYRHYYCAVWQRLKKLLNKIFNKKTFYIKCKIYGHRSTKLFMFYMFLSTTTTTTTTFNFWARNNSSKTEDNTVMLTQLISHFCLLVFLLLLPHPLALVKIVPISFLTSSHWWNNFLVNKFHSQISFYFIHIKNHFDLKLIIFV